MKEAPLDEPQSVEEPRATTSVMADLPSTLRGVLEASVRDGQRRKSVLISSNSLANRFILDKWGIRPSQRKRNKNLFSISRKHARKFFQILLQTGRIDWNTNDSDYTFGVFKFDEIRGNLILGFIPLDPESPWNSRFYPPSS
ncbi:MAG: hypothetical protein ACFFD6_03910 [Candidatus Thorarchaeota archaeon]